ncbi:MAG: hypothetical protein IT348_07160 [Candidatus Eisenbacteria bacterium]|nr:hypothetical protein [Candidatus Eisenbacteria bacterium]
MPLAKFAQFALLLAVVTFGASRADAAQLSLSPADTTVQLGDTFTLRVECDAVSDLKGLQTAWSYSAVRLQLIAMPAGNVFTDAGGDWFAQLLADVAPADTAWMDAAMLDGSTSGPGVVAYLTFKALVPGDAHIGCVTAEIRNGLNVSLAPSCTGGVVRVAAPVPAVKRSWGKVKSLRR